MKKGKLLYVQLLLFLAITATLKEGEAKKEHFRQKISSKVRITLTLAIRNKR